MQKGEATHRKGDEISIFEIHLIYLSHLAASVGAQAIFAEGGLFIARCICQIGQQRRVDEAGMGICLNTV